MKLLEVSLAVCVLALMSPSGEAQNAEAQNVEVAPAAGVYFGEITLELSLEYYECIQPSKEPPPCVADSEEEKTTSCPSCIEWKKIKVRNNLLIALKEDSYSYEDGPPRANFLVRDVAEGSYGVTFPKTGFGYPILTQELYDNYAAYGWTALPEFVNKTGAIAVWKGHAGIVVGETANGAIKIVYPSDTLNGLLTVDTLDEIGLGEPRFVLPVEVLQRPAER